MEKASSRSTGSRGRSERTGEGVHGQPGFHPRHPICPLSNSRSKPCAQLGVAQKQTEKGSEQQTTLHSLGHRGQPQGHRRWVLVIPALMTQARGQPCWEGLLEDHTVLPLTPLSHIAQWGSLSWSRLTSSLWHASPQASAKAAPSTRNTLPAPTPPLAFCPSITSVPPPLRNLPNPCQEKKIPTSALNER